MEDKMEAKNLMSDFLSIKLPVYIDGINTNVSMLHSALARLNKNQSAEDKEFDSELASKAAVRAASYYRLLWEQINDDIRESVALAIHDTAKTKANCI
jgi:hypothetical protein